MSRMLTVKSGKASSANILLFLALFCLTSKSLFADEIQLAIANYPPFSKHDGTGYVDVITEQMIARSELPIAVVKLPLSRVINTYGSKEYPIQFGVLNNHEIEEIQQSYFLPVFDFTLKFAFQTKRSSELNRPLDELAKITVASIRSSNYSHKIVMLEKGVSIVETMSVDQSMRMVQSGRADIALCVTLTCYDVISKMNLKTISVSDTSFDRSTAGFFVLKSHPRAKELRDRLQKSLLETFKSEEHQKLLNSYFGKQIPKEFTRYSEQISDQ